MSIRAFVRTEALALLAIALLATFTLSCSSGKASSTPGHGLAGLPTSISQLNDPAMTHVDKAQFGAMLASASSYQQGLIQDGSLTLDDYEKAELAEVNCLQSSGYEVAPHSTDLDGTARFNIQVANIHDIGAEQQARHKCEQEYTSVIDQIWAQITAQIERTVSDEARHFMATCLKGRGISVSQRPWSSSDPHLANAYSDCTKAMQAKYNVRNQFGVEGDENYP